MCNGMGFPLSGCPRELNQDMPERDQKIIGDEAGAAEQRFLESLEN